MLDVLKENLRPTDITFMLLLLTPGTVLLFVPALARWGRRWLAAVVLVYAVLSTQVGASLLARSLSHGYRPLTSAEEARGAQAIVILGGGSINVRAAGRQLSSVTTDAGLRVLEAARLFDLLNQPLVIASGGVTERDPAAVPESVTLQQVLIGLGVGPDRIVLESESKNTRDEVVILKRMLAERGLTRFVLVTSPLHMRRSMLAFEQQDLHPIPSPALLVPERLRGGSAVLPTNLWLSIGADAVYEWLARAYYWWQGWLA
jgi:uncharacterized SAM-binding protein YcdF (DUF218 family)